MYMYNTFISLYMWNEYNIIIQLYPTQNLKKKVKHNFFHFLNTPKMTKTNFLLKKKQALGWTPGICVTFQVFYTQNAYMPYAEEII